MINEPLTLADAETALQFISPDLPRDEWFRVAAALKDEYGELAFDAFDSWSQQGANYDKSNCQSSWRSAKPGHVRIGSLIKLAIDGGWQRPQRDLSPEEKKRLAAEHEAARAARLARIEADEAHLAAMQEAVAVACRALVKAHTKPATEHAYLSAKQVPGVGMRQAARAVLLVMDDQARSVQLLAGAEVKDYWAKAPKDRPENVHLFSLKRGDLVLPLYRADRLVWLVQSINAQGEKRFPKFARKKGSFTVLGKPDADQPLGFAEGWATGASVHHVMGWPVVVCIDAGNLAEAAAELLPTVECTGPVWLADNDVNGAGQQAAAACQQRHGGVIALPVFQNAQAQEKEGAHEPENADSL